MVHAPGPALQRWAIESDTQKLRIFFLDIAKLAGHAASKGGRTGLMSGVILQGTKIKLFQFPTVVHSNTSGLVIPIVLFSVAVGFCL